MRREGTIDGKSPVDRDRWLRRGFAVLAGVMLGLSFPPSSAGILATVALVPLLLAIDRSPRPGAAMRTSYLSMLVFHVITLNWTGGYSHGNDMYMMVAGGVTMLLHPLFYLLPLGAYILVRQRVGETAALVAFPVFWVAYEYSHTLSQWSFPWLTLGHSQSYDVAAIQFISITGVFGLSLWLAVLNVLGYRVVRLLLSQRTTPRRLGALAPVAAWMVIYLLPHLHGWWVLGQGEDPAAPPPGDSVTIGILQPNLDPWEKWTTGGSVTVHGYVSLTDSLLRVARDDKPDIVLWPETAVPYALLAPQNQSALEDLRSSLRQLDVSVLTGLPHAVYYDDTTRAPAWARRSPVTGDRYEMFNAAAFIQPDSSAVPWYGKMRMVPFAERIPYAEAFSGIDFLRWGVGIGGWQIGPDTTVFRDRRTSARFSAVICYESVYPEFTAAFVRRGAEFIVILTIDSWWGKMSGAYQHHRFAVLRAVETGRWVARCALGGISCFIDPQGRVYDATDLMTRTVLWRRIPLETKLTPYVRWGDWLGRTFLWSGLALGVWALLLPVFRKKRNNP